jgi:hypothetical protein
MNKNFKVTFLNHASFAIETDESITLVDPWYFGRIFNNSWSLLKDTDDSQIDYSKVKYISVSHEHPDHLHWPTLKHIRSKTDEDITIIFPHRTNPNVMDECKKLGFSFAYIDHYIETEIEDGYSITAFPEGHDSALVYRIGDKVICNQNDAYLDEHVLPKMKEMFPVIDLWLFQFSLAGYYGNSTEPEVIKQRGTQFHIDKFIGYQNYLHPKMSVPFASYVYFCKQYNDYINDYAVSLKDILSKVQYPTHVPYYNEEISLTSIENNQTNLEKWDVVIQNGRDNITPVGDFVGEDVVISELNKLYEQGYRIEGPGAVILEFFDYHKNLVINTSTGGEFIFIDKEQTPQQWVAGILPTEELYAYLKTPWGGDTLNITGAFIKKNQQLWHIFLMARENLYQR